jgi:hypothetical protein
MFFKLDDTESFAYTMSEGVGVCNQLAIEPAHGLYLVSGNNNGLQHYLIIYDSRTGLVANRKNIAGTLRSLKIDWNGFILIHGHGIQNVGLVSNVYIQKADYELDDSDGCLATDQVANAGVMTVETRFEPLRYQYDEH